MINKKTKIIILILIILLIVIFCITIFLEKDSSSNKNTSVSSNIIQTEYISDIETVEELEVEINESIINALTQVEEDYQLAKENYDGYNRSDFYNELRINKEMTIGEISFINVSDISTDILYNTKGEQIEELSEVTFNGTKVELESDSNIIEGKYYLIRCESGQMYNYYYVMTISNTGKASIEWLCYTENEIIDSGILEEIETDSLE